MLGFPNVEALFSKAVISTVLSSNPAPFMIGLVSILKLLLMISSIWWFVLLIRNAEFTYRKHRTNTFYKYLAKLAVTGVITFVIMLIIQSIIS